MRSKELRTFNKENDFQIGTFLNTLHLPTVHAEHNS